MTSLKMCTLAVTGLLMSFTPQRTASASAPVHRLFYSAPSIEWKRTEVDLGEIAQNKPVTVEFEFKNTGKLPVIISSVQASCGCTSTNYSKAPVQPGETTKITAIYNAASKGSFKKTVSVVTNAKDAPETLVITGTVI